MPATLSPGLQKLVREPAYCQLATLMRDSSPQVTRVWVDTDGEHILINTPEGFQKVRNVGRDPRVAVNVHDPANPWRIANIRGRVVEVTTDGADQFIDQLAKKYLGVDSYPIRQPGHVRTTLNIAPEGINEAGLLQPCPRIVRYQAANHDETTYRSSSADDQ